MSLGHQQPFHTWNIYFTSYSFLASSDASEVVQTMWWAHIMWQTHLHGTLLSVPQKASWVAISYFCKDTEYKSVLKGQ